MIFSLLHASAWGAGLSLFEEYFSSAQEQLPFPISELRRALVDPSSISEPDAHDFLFIPFGRSIQRTTTDLCHPRVVTAIESPRGTTYMGYSEKAQSLEVISWNESRHRNEFLQVKNYEADGHPELVHSERSLCMSCHQNGGPLLSRAPWRELNNPFLMQQFYTKCLQGEVSEMLRGPYKLYQGIKVFRSFGRRSDEPADDNGTSCLLPGLNPGCKIDSAIRASEQLLQEVQACRSLCPKNDPACKEELNRLKISASAFLPLNDIDKQILNRLVANALPSAVLPDRNPNLPEPHVFLLKNGSSTDLNLNIVDGDYLARGEDAKFASPQERRPPALKFLDYNFLELERLSDLNQAGALTMLVRTCLKRMPDALEAEEVSLATDPPKTGAAMFGFYCGKCHGEGSNVRLPLDDLQRLRAVRNEWGASAQDLLREHRMPRTALDVPALSENQRDVLIRMLDETGS